jgi:hypothetical protein
MLISKLSSEWKRHVSPTVRVGKLGQVWRENINVEIPLSQVMGGRLKPIELMYAKKAHLFI